MNIKNIGLERLYHDIASVQSLSNADIDCANKILFGMESPSNPKGDVIFVFGSQTCLEDRIQKGIELFQKGAAEHILLSGGVKIPDTDVTEAEGMAQYCIRDGIPASSIILENKSTITYENVIFSAPYVNELDISNPIVLAVTSASHMRRAMMNFDKYKNLYQSKLTVIPCQSIHPSCHPNTWYKSEESRNLVAKELYLIENHIHNGDYNDFEI